VYVRKQRSCMKGAASIKAVYMTRDYEVIHNEVVIKAQKILKASPLIIYASKLRGHKSIYLPIQSQGPGTEH